MLRPLFRKELEEHRVAILVWILIELLLMLLLYFGSTVHELASSRLEPFRSFLISTTVLSCLFLGHLLVTREYTGQTQLFLETLPVTRFSVFLAKFMTGLGLVLAINLLGLLGFLKLASAREPLGALFVSYLLARTIAYTFFVYTFFFVTSFLGRYRFLVYVLLFFFAFLLEVHTDYEIAHLSPFVLVNVTFSSERRLLPGAHLLWTLGVSLGLTVTAAALALLREGSVPARMAQKMTHREKVFIAITLLAGVLFFIVVDEKTQKKPFDLSDSVVAVEENVVVKLSLDEDRHRASGQRMVERLAHELVALRDYLELGAMPQVSLISRPDLDPDRYERGKLERGEGLLARIAFPAEGWNEEDFLAWLVQEVVDIHSEGRSELEAGRWVLDGFGPYWVRRNRPGADLWQTDAQLTLRALYGTQTGFGREDTARWLTFREKVGTDIATAVAWSGLETLALWRGESRCQAFLRGVLAPKTPHDGRALWHRLQFPLEHIFQERTGVAYDAFLMRWRQELEAGRLVHKSGLERLPRLSGDLVVSPDAPGRLRGFLEASPPQDPAQRGRLRYAKIPFYNKEIDEEDVQVDDQPLGRFSEGVDLVDSFSSGTRLAWTFALHDPTLGCDVISGWVRQEIP